MPRRPAATRPLSPPPPPRDSSSADVPHHGPLSVLRTHWKWAAFGQFFFTFNHLFAMSDLSLSNIEDDLVNGSRLVLPRIMHRLLYVLSYDRKVTLNNWQTALRKQYRRRDPAANPIGPEPRADDPDSEPDRESSPPSPNQGGVPTEELNGENNDPDEKEAQDSPAAAKSTPDLDLDPDADAKRMSVQPSEAESDSRQRARVNGALEQQSEEQEESKDWLELPMLAKLDSMHTVMEWQFHNPTRLRTLMRSEDENASWRIEPIGYDAKKNAYWLIGADRLWIQRHIPKPPRPKNTGVAASSLKRKRATATPASKPAPRTTNKGRSEPAPSKRRKLDGRAAADAPTTERARAAKARAKIKLDRQAMELAEFQRQQAGGGGGARNGKAARAVRGSGGVGESVSPGKAGRTTTRAAAAKGTRASARLRGTTDEDGWQAIPEEWLYEGVGAGVVCESDEEEERQTRTGGKVNGQVGVGKHKERELRTGLESDGSEISDLTEFSEDSTSDDEGEDSAAEADDNQDAVVKKEESPKLSIIASRNDTGLEDQPILPGGFIEWETICVTLYEWEHIAERFQKATHYSEKALYKELVNNLVPAITEELREIDRKQRLTVAMAQRKRSSRLLLRQSEKEEAEVAARRIAEEAERNSRAKRQAARAKREEEAREKRELARELRRREREEMEEMEITEKCLDVDGEHVVVDVGGDGVAPTVPQQNDAAGRKLNGKSGTKSGSRTPIGEEWELDCEICHRRGINLDDGTPMMSCGMCSKWQHIACHDLADQKAGKRRRNWDLVEFICLQCRTKRDEAAATGFRGPSAPGTTQHGQACTQSQGNPYLTHPTMGGYNNPYLGSALKRHQYPVGGQGATVNGSAGTMYLRDYQGAATSNMRSAPAQQRPVVHISPSHLQPPSQQRQQHDYATPISFSHYQPHQRGFSSSAQQVPYPVGNVQPYGQAAFLNQYSQQYPVPMVNGSGSRQPQASQQPTLTSQQNRWNMVSSSSYQQQPPPQVHQTPPLDSSNARDGLSSAMPSAPHGHHPVMPTSRSPHLPWQDNLNGQRVTQSHYHPSLYRPAPS